jgi:predicted metalloprotease with PDZ domain
MLGDVLPIFGKNANATAAKVKMVLPMGWRQMENRIDDIVETRDVASEVVAVGKDIRFRKVHVDNTAITICIAGEWLFTGDEIISAARDNYLSLREVFGADASNDLFISIFRFPQETSAGQWQADTRGRNITIISSDMPFKSQSLQRLHEQLRHEIFHLWIPNGVNLSGNYDWFYEGFALYESLKLGVAVNRIRFDDFLDTLSRAYDIDAMQSRKTSLIEASKNRWAGANTQVYARGMLVAFLCDIALLEKSKGKRSVADLLRMIYETHRPPSPERDGNSVVLALLQSHSELVSLVDRYIVGEANIDWTALITAAGLETESIDQVTKLKVMTKPNGRQKDLLNKLGYNNWRKLTIRR